MLLMLFLRRQKVAVLWPFYAITLVILLLLAYVFSLGLPPVICIGKWTIYSGIFCMLIIAEVFSVLQGYQSEQDTICKDISHIQCEQLSTRAKFKEQFALLATCFVNKMQHEQTYSVNNTLHEQHTLGTTYYTNNILHRQHATRATCSVNNMLHEQQTMRTTCYMKKYAVPATCYMSSMQFWTTCEMSYMQCKQLAMLATCNISSVSDLLLYTLCVELPFQSQTYTSLRHLLNFSYILKFMFNCLVYMIVG